MLGTLWVEVLFPFQSLPRPGPKLEPSPEPSGSEQSCQRDRGGLRTASLGASPSLATFSHLWVFFPPTSDMVPDGSQLLVFTGGPQVVRHGERGVGWVGGWGGSGGVRTRWGQWLPQTLPTRWLAPSVDQLPLLVRGLV